MASASAEASSAITSCARSRFSRVLQLGNAKAAARTPVRASQPTAPTPAVSVYDIHGGTVQASDHDPHGLVGLQVRVYNNFWLGYEGDYDRTSCPVVARCIRPFLRFVVRSVVSRSG